MFLAAILELDCLSKPCETVAAGQSCGFGHS